MQTMERKKSTLAPPKGGRMQLGAMISNEDPNKWLKRAGVAVAGGTFLYWSSPEIHNLVFERQNLLGLMLAGGGLAVAAAGNEKGHVSFRERSMGRNVAIGVGTVLGIGGLVLAGNNARGEWFGGDDNSVPMTEVAPPASFVTGDTVPQVITSTVVNQDGSNCEILIDFNNVPQTEIDSGRNVADARRLQYIAYEMGGYSEFGATGDFSEAEKETYIDGFLGPQSGTAIAHLRSSIGLPPADPSWGAEMCSAIPTLSDGDPSTPSFSNMPELQFAG